MSYNASIGLFLGLIAMPLSAQQATLDRFDQAQAEGFSLLVPGENLPHDQEDQISEEPPRNSELPAKAIPQSAPVSLSTTQPFVPGWMRGGRSRFQLNHNSSRQFLMYPDCGSTAFYSRIDLPAEAQARRRLYFPLVVNAACEAGVPVRLFDGVIAQESHYQPYARSHAGAQGLAQLMPGTARYLGVSNVWDPQENLRGGARYLREQLDRYGTWELALAAYNAGPGNVDKYGGVPPFRETRDYVRRIFAGLGSVPGQSLVQSEPVASNPFRRAHLARFDRPLEIPED